jgi:adenine-specific DNA-methyltransferase
MDYSTKSRNDLITLCKENKIKGCSNKKKEELIALLSAISKLNTAVIPGKKGKPKVGKLPVENKTDDIKINRLNYIGSKFQLLEWLTDNIVQQTGLKSFKDIRFADLFAGTGIVSHHFRQKDAIVLSNDAELYSSIIAYAFTASTYTDKCKKVIDELNEEIASEAHKDVHGFITKNYSPYNDCERMFFTVENAQRIDYIRQRIEECKGDMEEPEYNFLVASLLLSADAVSNVPAVYGCYLKNFKAKALKELTLKPIHTNTKEVNELSKAFNADVLSDKLLKEIKADIVYLDPPYNERQYSKNYFPLNMIALSPDKQKDEKPLKGKTGIPESCFISPFCKKGATVEQAFEKLFTNLNTEWIFLSYNSESLITKERMIELMQKYGEVTTVERDYKRFKSFEYNEDKQIKEYLFCLHKQISP